MRIGIRPINDFAFKKIFETIANELALISFLNAVLCLRVPIVKVTIVNPYNLQDFLGRYNLTEAELATASMRDRWLYWFLHAHEYEPEALLKLFPEAAMQLATQTITKIAEITEDKTMYDAREKAIRDQQWALNAAHREGEIKGEIKGETKGKIELIRILEGILGLTLSSVADLQKLDLEALQKLTSTLQDRTRNRA